MKSLILRHWGVFIWSNLSKILVFREESLLFEWSTTFWSIFLYFFSLSKHNHWFAGLRSCFIFLAIDSLDCEYENLHLFLVVNISWQLKKQVLDLWICCGERTWGIRKILKFSYFLLSSKISLKLNALSRAKGVK